MGSPTQRTLKYCRDRGWNPGIVERWIERAKKRIDLWGFADIACLDDGPGVLLIQTCSGTDHSKRKRKILENKLAYQCLKRGNRILVISWTKRGPRGKRKVWTERVEEITTEDFLNYTPIESPAETSRVLRTIPSAS